jgi:hypothetical protein
MAEIDEEKTHHFCGDGHGYGPVKDAEVVLHAVFDGTKRIGNRLTPDAFPPKNLKRGEVSVARQSYICRSAFEVHIILPLVPILGEFLGAAPAPVQKLREIVYRVKGIVPPIEGRAICVLDKVVEGDDESHAAIAYSASHDLLNESWKKSFDRSSGKT